MATHPILEVTPRTVTGKKVSALRRQGIIPGHIYGHGESTMIQFDQHTFERMRELRKTGGVVDLQLPGTSQAETVLVRHVEHRPSTGKIQHVDFFRVRMNETIKAKVQLRIAGEPPVVKREGAVVFFLQETVEITALPDNLPESLNVDAALLTALDSVVYAKDLHLPNGVTLVSSPDEPLVRVQPSRTEAAEPAAATEPAKGA